MDRAEIGWAAGFFDGEGTAYTARNRQGRCYLHLSVANSDREALERVQAVIGGRIYETNDRSNPLARKQMYVLKIMRRAEVIRAVSLLSPFLTRPKLEAIQRAQELESANPPAEGYGHRIWETRRARYGPTGRRAGV